MTRQPNRSRLAAATTFTKWSSLFGGTLHPLPAATEDFLQTALNLNDWSTAKGRAANVGAALSLAELIRIILSLAVAVMKTVAVSAAGVQNAV